MTSDKAEGWDALCVVMAATHLVSWARKLEYEGRLNAVQLGLCWMTVPCRSRGYKAVFVRRRCRPVQDARTAIHTHTHTGVHAWRYACARTRPHKAPHTHPSPGVTVKVMTSLSGRRGGVGVAACHICANFDFKSWRKISERLNREGEKKLLTRSFHHQPL